MLRLAVFIILVSVKPSNGVSGTCPTIERHVLLGKALCNIKAGPASCSIVWQDTMALTTAEALMKLHCTTNKSGN